MAESDKLLRELVSLFKRNDEVIQKQCLQAMQAKGLLAELSIDEVKGVLSKGCDTYMQSLETGEFNSARAYAKAIAEQSVLAGLTSEETLMGILSLRDAHGRVIFENYGKYPEKWAKVRDIYEPVANTILNIASDAFVKERERLIKQ